MDCTSCLGSRFEHSFGFGSIDGCRHEPEAVKRTCMRCAGSGVEPTQIRLQVAEFHRAMGQPILERPQVPSEERVRLRLKLIAEEFFELLDSALPNFASSHRARREAEANVLFAIESCPIAGTPSDIREYPVFELDKFADALADLDYVIEGTRLEFGINGAPIANAVHAANMKKTAGPVREDGKKLKPLDWKAPDIVGELKKQGWEG